MAGRVALRGPIAGGAVPGTRYLLADSRHYYCMTLSCLPRGDHTKNYQQRCSNKGQWKAERLAHHTQSCHQPCHAGGQRAALNFRIPSALPFSHLTHHWVLRERRRGSHAMPRSSGPQLLSCGGGSGSGTSGAHRRPEERRIGRRRSLVLTFGGRGPGRPVGTITRPNIGERGALVNRSSPASLQ